jgi:tRNA threonylcarbamoyladenosine biosynthesis protein TsaB
VLDAGRGEFYFGEYADRRCLRESLMGERDVLAAIAGGIVVVCEAKVEEALAGFGAEMVPEPSAGDALSLALARIEAHDFDDAASLDAKYLRRTDVEIFAKPSKQRVAK